MGRLVGGIFDSSVLHSVNAPRTSFLPFIPLLVNRSPNKLASKVSKNMLTNQPSCSFASFLIVLLSTFTNKPDT